MRIVKLYHLFKIKRRKKITLSPEKIATKGAKECYVIDHWKLHNELAESSGFKWVIIIYSSIPSNRK